MKNFALLNLYTISTNSLYHFVILWLFNDFLNVLLMKDHQHTIPMVKINRNRLSTYRIISLCHKRNLYSWSLLCDELELFNVQTYYDHYSSYHCHFIDALYRFSSITLKENRVISSYDVVITYIFKLLPEWSLQISVDNWYILKKIWRFHLNWALLHQFYWSVISVLKVWNVQIFINFKENCVVCWQV